MRFLLAFLYQLVKFGESTAFRSRVWKQVNYVFVFLIIKPDTIPSPMTMVKSHEKKCRNYFRVTTSQLTRYSRVKYCRNVIFEEIDKPSTGKNDEF